MLLHVLSTGVQKAHFACWQGTVEEKFEEMQASREAPDAPELDADGKPLTKKARAALIRAAEKEREARRLAASERIELQVIADTHWPVARPVACVILQHGQNLKCRVLACLGVTSNK
jgi:methionine-rich copper-binding protein CopC